MATLGEVAKMGALASVGFIGHKALTKLFCDNILDRFLGSAGTVTPPAAPAVSGLEMLQPYRNVIGGAVVGAAAVWVADKAIKDTRTKMFITAGIATSFVHATAVAILSKFMPQVTGYLAGHDGTAASISAMYGLGAGASLQPHYAPISATGEYFAQNGIGEYFAQNGFGNGLGSYGANPDLMQAAAGYGIVENTNSDHVNPGDDLDRQLSIAEAAAGVGALPAYEAAAGMGKVQPFEASAGIGEYFAQNGFGAVSTVPPTADTWIPGSVDGQIWAGTRSISQGQSANELNSAGILETSGNNGVFG